MQRESKIMRKMFIHILRQTTSQSASFPEGGLISKKIMSCIAKLTSHYSTLGAERIADYCIFQIYRMSCMTDQNKRRWRVANAFTESAVRSFVSRSDGCKYYEDRWLEQFNLGRKELAGYFETRSTHPMARFIYPEYEERTKLRAISTEAGYCICLLSTMLWTPFSKACQECIFATRCRGRTMLKFPELYRIRIEHRDGEELKYEQ